jgi:hypothetical protein
MRLFIFFILFIYSIISNGQIHKILPYLENNLEFKNAAQKSSLITTDLHLDLSNNISANKWCISVKPTYSHIHYSQELLDVKESKMKTKLNSLNNISNTLKTAAIFDPTIGTNFEANWSISSTPSDNSMAISNSGFIVSANNDGIEYYNSNGNFLYTDFWSDFFNDITLTGSIYDPKVIYDSGSDRFVMIVLHGNSASNSKVLVCFSKSNNPKNDGWYVYKLTGNPLNNNCWFDYPSLGVSNNEIYITGNLFITNGSFSQSVIYQIPKYSGYAGVSLNWQYWSNLNSSPFAAFSLVPASFGHQGNYGPGIYFVSNKSTGDNRIRLWDLTNDIGSNPQLNSYIINTASYSPSADAFQLGSTDKLKNGDCRIQSAFYLNGIIHYVFHTDLGSGWNGISYNRLSTGNLTNQFSNFGLQGSDYSYPSVASFSTIPSDNSVMISFLESSLSVYPRIKVVNCDNNFQWSKTTLVKSGETYINFLNGDERWGDYTGISRRHNSVSPVIWLSGCYGANVLSNNKFNTYKTWIAEVYGTNPTSLQENLAISKTSIFPNPTYDLININFLSESYEKTTIQILDINGRVVKILYDDFPRIGENKLVFNKGALEEGSYFINIFTTSKVLKNEKIVIFN